MTFKTLWLIGLTMWGVAATYVFPRVTLDDSQSIIVCFIAFGMGLGIAALILLLYLENTKSSPLK